MVVCGALALCAAAKVGEDVFHHETTSFDQSVRSWVLAHQVRAVHSIFYWVTSIGSVTPMVGYGVLGALLLWKHGRRHVVSAVLLAPVAAVGTYLGVKRLYDRTRPSIAGQLEGTSSFPSAHATTSSAIAFTLAYVFWKEGLINGTMALLLGSLVPLLIGASRVYLDMHWATDVLGGWSAGLVIAAMSAALYQRIGTTPVTVSERRALKSNA